MRMSKKSWLNNKNILYGFILVILLIILFITWMYNANLNHELQKSNDDVASWQHKLDTLTTHNNKVIYLPRPGDVNLSTNQANSVKDLTSLFSQLTTYNSETSYQTNMNLAKSKIHDASFYKDFLVPYQQIQNLSLMSKNVRTQVLSLGKNHYQVIVIYIPYHNNSDLYQEANARTAAKVFDVVGQNNQYSIAKIQSQFLTQLNQSLAGNF